jgi:hypothetical protein
MDQSPTRSCTPRAAGWGVRNALIEDNWLCFSFGSVARRLLGRTGLSCTSVIVR